MRLCAALPTESPNPYLRTLQVHPYLTRGADVGSQEVRRHDGLLTLRAKLATLFEQTIGSDSCMYSQSKARLYSAGFGRQRPGRLSPRSVQWAAKGVLCSRGTLATGERLCMLHHMQMRGCRF